MCAITFYKNTKKNVSNDKNLEAKTQKIIILNIKCVITFCILAVLLKNKN